MTSVDSVLYNNDLLGLILSQVSVKTVCRLLREPPNKRWYQVLQSDKLWRELHHKYIKFLIVSGWNKDNCWQYSFRLNYYQKIVPDWNLMVTVSTGLIFATRYKGKPILHPKQLSQCLIIERRSDRLWLYTPRNIMGLTQYGEFLSEETIWQTFLYFPYYPVKEELGKYEKVEGVRMVNYFIPPTIDLL